MSRGGATPKKAPVGWVFLERHGFTIRWRRGDPVAYVLEGKQVGEHRMTEVLDTIPVSPAGWTDLAEIRLLAQRWLRTALRPARSAARFTPCPDGISEASDNSRKAEQ